MTLRTCNWPILALLLLAAPALADELDDIVRKVDPPARFADYKPDFRVEKQTFSFKHYGGDPANPEQGKAVPWEFWVVRDGQKYVALIPIPGFHAGTIYLQDFRPTHAPTKLDLPTERWHIDTAVGYELQTQAYMPDDVGQTEASYKWETGENTITMIRHFKGTASYNRWAHRDKQPQKVDAESRFVFRVDPIHGYVVEGTYDIKAERFPGRYQFTSHAQSGRYAVWPGEETCFRNICTPIGKQGYLGYTMNQPSIIRGRLSCRDGGFVGFLNDKTGWSSATTIKGNNAPIGVCNAHADLDLTTIIPKDLPVNDQGLKRWVQKHRLIAMPPEVTRYLWDKMEVLFEGDHRVVIRVGQVEDFEDQPLPMTTRHRGMAFTGNDPPLSTQHARSGKRSLVVSGNLWPNIPQVNLQPNQRYRVEAWVRIEKWSDEQLEAVEAKARERHARDHEKLKENITRWEKEIEEAKAAGREPNGKTLSRLVDAKAKLAEWKAFDGIGPQQFTIGGDLYEWTPHGGPMLIRQATNPATADKDGWQHISLEFTSPEWGPFINIAFRAQNCTAYVDDFQLIPVKEEVAKGN